MVTQAKKDNGSDLFFLEDCDEEVSGCGQ